MALSTTIHQTAVRIGDTVRISQNIREGEKTRIQNFSGVLIAIRGGNQERTITIRKVGAGGVGIEKTYPVDLPSITAVTVAKHAVVNRAKLYFLRERSGKSALLLRERKQEAAHGDTRVPGRTVRTGVSPTA